MPVPTAATRPFWTAAAHGHLALPRCSACESFLWPPPSRCPQCLNDRLVWETLSGRGRVVGWTRIHAPVIPGVTTPFVIGDVELVEQRGLVIPALMGSSSAGPPCIDQVVQLQFAPSGSDDIGYPEFHGVAS